jgi:type II secretory pathway component PulJ
MKIICFDITQKAARREEGFSLLELMISMTFLAISMLGLLSLTTTSIQANLENDIRNGSVRLINQTAEILLAEPIERVVTCGVHAEPNDLAGVLNNQAPFYNVVYPYSAGNTCLGGAGIYSRYPNPTQAIRGTMTYPYNITWTVSNLTSDLSQANITVKYLYRGRVTIQQAVIYKHKTI